METKSAIKEITVYPDSALVRREAELKLNPGETGILFPDIIPEIDENSLRVSGKGNADVKILGAKVKREYLEETPDLKLKALEKEMEKFHDTKRTLEDEIKAAQEGKVFLNSIQMYSKEQLPRELITRMPQSKELEDIYQFLSSKIKENYEKIMQTQFTIRETDKKIQSLQNQIDELSGGYENMKRSIEVELEVREPGDFLLSVSYLVNDATWESLYDARADFNKNEVELISYAIVRQTTGEDWQDVEMSLSTAKPAVGGSMPLVEPWFLRFCQPRQYFKSDRLKRSMAMKAQEEAFDEQGEAELAMNDAIASKAMGAAAAPAQAPAEVFSRAQEKGTAISYKLTRKVSLKSDGTDHKLPITSQVLTGQFQYSSYPRSVLNAFLGSRVTNSKDVQLLSGRVNIFLEGDFVGSSNIPDIGPGEEFDLYLGVDENVKVKREQIEKRSDETLVAGILSPTRKVMFRYKLSLENYKSKKISVKLFEAMPISQDDRIKVKIGNVSLDPKEKDWKDRKGVWLWELELAPREKKEITYTFHVDHPRNLAVEGI
ncbi:MAG: mucoidy inhibitor MuiA family protein [bacterium]|nr:mucoidy inhibitor MuiA family protein [bacterium]